jgi:two-component system, chemotaxis family, chemotaxis protein CheY
VSLKIGNVSVLVLDDHRFMQQVMRLILNGLGVRKVVCVDSVDAALDVLATETFDIVIADYLLGGKTGAQFTRLARTTRSGGDRFIPIIACTADTTPRTIQELRDAGADEILGKPVSPLSVWSKITAVVNMRRKFVSTPEFFGPDRRRRNVEPPAGQERRASDHEVTL